MSDTLIPRRDTVPVPAVLNTRLDEFLAGPYDPETDARAGSRRGRRLFWADGFVSNASESFVTNFTNPFALALGNPTQIGLLAAANAGMNMIGQQVWGRLNDRKGAAWVMAMAGFMIPLVPAFYALVPNAWYLVAVEAFSGFMWAGYGLSSFNLMLGLAPAEQRARFSAVYQSAVFGASFVGPLLGMALVSIYNITLLFWLSAIGRIIASVLFMLAVRSGPAHE